MALEFNGTSHYLEASSGVSGVLSDFPLTMCAWVRPDNTGGGGSGPESVLVASDASSTSIRTRLQLKTDVDEDGVMNSHDGSTVGTASGGGAIDGSWQPLIGTDDGSDRYVYWNGGSATDSTNLSSLTGIDLVTIGAWSKSGGRQNYFNGGIAECAIWTRILSAAERASLQANFSPLFIPNGLVFYAPLWREVYDLVGGLALSGGSTGGQTDHPPIIYPTGPAIGHKAAASGPWTDPVGYRRVRIYTGYDASQRSAIKAAMEA